MQSAARRHHAIKPAPRASSTARGYDYLWQKLRRAFLSVNPLCVACARGGIDEPAIDVDHIVPHKGDDDLRLSWNNLQSLCKRCHGKKTYLENL